MLKLLVTDLDGTLLKIGNELSAGISDENREALTGFVREGGHVAIASSRGPDAVSYTHLHALYIVDQHAAQERVHFEEVQQRFLDQEPLMQELLVPIILEGSASVAARLQEMNELLEPMHIQMCIRDRQ